MLCFTIQVILGSFQGGYGRVENRRSGGSLPVAHGATFAAPPQSGGHSAVSCSRSSNWTCLFQAYSSPTDFTTGLTDGHSEVPTNAKHSTRALLEARSSSGRLSAPYRAAFTSQSRLLSSSGLKLGRSNRLSSPAALPRKFLLVKRPFEVSLFAPKSDCEPR